jgi:hypothetical protein
VTVPLKAVRAALGLPKSELLVLAYLGGRRNRTVPITHITQAIGLGRSTIVAAIRELEAKGILVAARPTRREWRNVGNRRQLVYVEATTYLLAGEYEPNNRAVLVLGVEVERLGAARGDVALPTILAFALLRTGLGEDAAGAALQLTDRTVRRVKAAMLKSAERTVRDGKELQESKGNVERPLSITASQPYLTTFKNMRRVKYLGSGQFRSAHDRLEGLIEGLEAEPTEALEIRPHASDARRQTARRRREGDRPTTSAGSTR